jgi:hypothetical protein
MQHQSTNALFQYWNRLRDGRSAPRRSEIEPADIKTLLADTFILEADTRGEPVFRLAGTRMCAIYGRELKGFSFPSIWRNKDHRMLSRLMRGVFTDRTLLTIDYQGISTQGRAAQFEMLLLPIESGSESQRCLGISTANQYTYWLGSDAVIDAEIASVRTVDPEREPLLLKNRPAVPLPGHKHSDSAPVLPSETASAARRVRHLLVLDGGIRN